MARQACARMAGCAPIDASRVESKAPSCRSSSRWSSGRPGRRRPVRTEADQVADSAETIERSMSMCVCYRDNESQAIGRLCVNSVSAVAAARTLPVHWQ